MAIQEKVSPDVIPNAVWMTGPIPENPTCYDLLLVMDDEGTIWKSVPLHSFNGVFDMWSHEDYNGPKNVTRWYFISGNPKERRWASI